MIVTETKKLPTILDVKAIANTRIFHIEQVTYQFNNGEIREFERLKVWDPGVVMIIPMLNPNTILLIKEYAAGINDYTLSFPKGRVDKSEDLFEAANRELQEEVGYKAKNLRYLMGMTTSPNYSSTLTHTFLAQNLVPSSLPADEPESLEVIAWKLDNIPALLARPDFHEARALAALYLVNQLREKD